MAKACTFIGNRDLSLNEQWALRPRLQQAILNYLNATSLITFFGAQMTTLNIFE